jgi:uncharacterized protein YdaU (DUF1376 family)
MSTDSPPESQDNESVFVGRDQEWDRLCDDFSQARKVLPYIRHYVANWPHDTEHLNATARGCLIDLLGRYWTDGDLPYDEAKLARYAHATPEEWRSVSEAVIGMFVVVGDRLHHRGLDKEREHAEGVSGGRSKGGKASGEARRKKANGS